MSAHQDDHCGSKEVYVPNVIRSGVDVPNFMSQSTLQGTSTTPVLPPQSAPQSQPATMMWPPNHQPQHMSTPFIQTASPAIVQQQPPQLYNELIYNIPFATPPGQPETYSVLPVGYGNFLKVYHCTENRSSADNTGLFAQNSATFQQQQAFVPHVQNMQSPNSASATVPLATQSQFYELFSGNPLLPKPEMTISPHLPTPNQQQQQQPHRTPLLQQEENMMSANSVNLPNSTNANIIINNLVNNWSPNLTGSAYTQLGDNPSVEAHQHEVNTMAEQPNMSLPQYQQTMPILPPQSPLKSVNLDVSTANKVQPSSVLLNASSHLPEVKKRIVAEVKPMRMSYSDVLSKGTVRQQQNSDGNDNNWEQNATKLRRQITDDINAQKTRSTKRSPTHEVKDNATMVQQPLQQVQQSIANSTGNQSNNSRSKKRSNNNGNATLNHNQSVSSVDKPKPLPQNQQQQTQIAQNKQKSTASNEVNGKKRGNNAGGQPKSSRSSNTSVTNKASEQNITKTNNNNNITPNVSNAASHVNNTANVRKSNRFSTTNFSNVTNNSSSNSSSSNKRYLSSNSNSNSNFGYSYSSKRNRNNGYSSNLPAMGASVTNRHYELLKRFLQAWWIYTMKLLTWLFYLVYDIVVIGCSMAYDQLTHASIAGVAYALQMYQELKQNSGKPNLWWRNFWRRFDARFNKNSRVAFWRRFYKKKPPEPVAESFKSGRLPQTGEEAMNSLLNCKGKDAYSILGVSPDSSPEQIRKHYKKIAVLVHPDKNKQAGAEEAFKVLQRAFELINEPENRSAYDQSLAKALHAEKAWTELHDLLSQLQTKMTEAANTIKCSTCSQRHPRKLTERPHYAARECASCKIRHPAKEGDIWAETSMMGLRWKYLALMEGKVYDITEWANCQKGALSHLEPNSHMVQYRIVRGAQQQQQQHHHQTQQQHHQQPNHYQQQQSHHHQYAQHERGTNSGASGGLGAGNTNGNGKYKRDIPPSHYSEASLHEFLDNLYSGQLPNQPNPSAPFAASTRRRSRRN